MNNKLTEQIIVRCTKSEKAGFKRDAKKAGFLHGRYGVNVSEYIRSLCRK